MWIDNTKIINCTNLNGISSSITSSLTTHELEAVAKTAKESSKKSPLPAFPVIQIGSEGWLWHAGHRTVEEQDVQPNADDETRDWEVEEGSVDHQVRDTIFQGVPLVVCGQVDCRGEEREADASEEHYRKPYEGVWSEYLEKEKTITRPAQWWLR